MFESDIWVGDLAKSLKALSPVDDCSADAIAELLGLTSQLRVEQAARLPDFGDSEADAVHKPPLVPGAGAAPNVMQNVRIERSPQSTNAALNIERVLEPIGSEPTAAARRWQGVEALQRPHTGAALAEPAHDPLLDARWHREIAVAATAQLLPLGLVDVAALVDRAARSLPVVRVPRKRRWSVNRGVQLLIDGGSGMDPFRKDQSAFTAVVRAVVGPERVEVVEFYDAPLRGVFDTATGGRREYEPPPPGVPIVLLSDLGYGHRARDGARATIREWQAFADAVAKRSRRIITFVPYPPPLLAPRLRRDLGAVYWDRSTAHRQIRDASKNAADPTPSPVRAGPDGKARRVVAQGAARDLAVLVSAAVFVEPELLRAMRLTLLPAAGPEVESAVWFSAAVRARNPSGIVFHADAAAGLRNTLKEAWRTTPELRARLALARDVMDRIHERQSAALRLEERLAWCIVTGDLSGAERELERALKAHADGKRPGIAAWAGPAWKRMPAQARRTRSGWLFHQLARTTAQGRDLPPVDPPPDLRPEDLSTAIAMVQDVKFGVRRLDETLELGNFSGEGAVAIMLPDTEPRIVDIVTAAGENRIEVLSRDRALLDAGRGPVTLKTLRGTLYRLPAMQPTASQVEQRRVAVSPQPREPRRSWGQTWPAWELKFEADGALVNPPVLAAPAADSLTDLFVLVHGWNASREDARHLYSRLLQEPSDRIRRGVFRGRRFGAMGVFWPSKLWSDGDDQPTETGLGVPDSQDDQSQLAELERTMSSEQRRRLSEASQRLAEQPDDPKARAQVRELQQELDSERTREASRGDAGTSSSGGLFGGLWSSAKNLARTTSFYGMRARAATVGRQGLGPALGQLAQISPTLRLHVIAHSVGARLASYAVQAERAASSDVRPVKSLVLLQPVLARYAFAPALPADTRRGGALVSVARHVDGPIVVTYSANDQAAALSYEVATRLAGGDDDAPGERAGKAMGYDGAQGVNAFRLRLGPVGTIYPLEAGRVGNVDASSFIKGHGDVTIPEVAWLILAAADAATLNEPRSTAP
jgi:hypothetical protein